MHPTKRPIARVVASALVVAALVALGCSDEITPTAVETPGASLAIVEGADDGDNAHFFFLPPLVEQPTFNGVFDGSLSPVVEICEWDGTACATPLTARLTTDVLLPSRIRVDEEEEHYLGLWATRSSPVTAGQTYRIAVLVDDFLLGYLDLVALDRNDHETPNGFKVGRTLPIKFRIEIGALGPRAQFTVGGTQQAGSAATFDASASGDPAGGGLQYAWDFGDGRRGGGAQVSHIYADGGSFTVTLVVTDANGRSASAIQSVSIAEPPAPAGEATLSGRVLNARGDRLAGVTVVVVGSDVSGTTDASGAVRLSPVGTGVSVNLRLTKAGFADRLLQVDVPPEVPEAYFEARMIAREPPQTLAAAENGGTVSGSDGVVLELPAGSVLDAGGNPVTGEIEVTLTPIDVSGDEIATFPGSFTGVRTDGRSGLLLTYGVAEFVLSQGGSELQLALGEAATIEIPIYTGGTAQGDEIPLWSLDEVTGSWIEEGVGVVVASSGSPTGLALRAVVTHLSWWNIDVWVEAPYEPLVRCLEGGVPVECTISALVDDPSFPRTYATSWVGTEGNRLTFPADIDAHVVGLNTDGTLTGDTIVNGPSGGGAADTVNVYLVQRPVHGPSSTVAVSDDTLLVGETSVVTVRAKYADGTDATEGGANVIYSISGGALVAQGIFGPVTDNGDGTYQADFTATRAGTPATVDALINFQSITTPRPTITVLPGALTGAEAEALIAESFLTWWTGTEHWDPSMGLSVAADELTSSWLNFAMYDLSKEPRIAWNNSPDYDRRQFTERPWLNMYLALSAVYEGITAINSGVVIGAGTADSARALAFAKFVQGLAHGWLALMFDQAFVFDESVNLVIDQLSLRPYGEVMDAALAALDETIAIAGAHSFTLPTTWINGRAITNAELAQLAHAYAARFMSQVARTPPERDAVDWPAVAGHVDQGITADFTIDGDGFFGSWLHALQYLGNDPFWARVDYKTLGPADTSGAFTSWLADPVEARTEFDIETADRRVTAAGDPTGEGTDFAWVGAWWFRPERGTYHFSTYAHKRYEAYYLADGFAPMTAMTLTGQRLIKAEALLRSGDPAGAASIMNETRVGRGQLPPATASDPDLFEQLTYEKRIENFIVCSGCAFFDRRGFGPLAPTGPTMHQGLVWGTPLHFPVPGSELERLGLPNYTFGGSGPAMVSGVLAGTTAVPASAVYRFRIDGSGAELLAILRASNAATGPPARQ